MVLDQQPPTRKPSACVPCHERKIRCDSVQVGLPCSRCISKDRTRECILIQKNFKKRKRDAGDSRTTQQESTSAVVTTGTPDSIVAVATPVDNNHSWDAHLNGDVSAERRRYPSHGSMREPPVDDASRQYTISEEDAHLQTFCRMSGEDRNLSPTTGLGSPDQGKHQVEYYGKLNSISFLGEVLGQRRRRRLIRIELPGPRTISVTQRELSGLEPSDVAYLNEKRVHGFPPKRACDQFLRLFFEHVYPYTPILDRVQLLEDHNRNNCSSFLFYSILANVVPYASSELLLQAGYVDRITAQKDFFTRAKLLYDFGCEKNQLSLLQGSVLLSSHQYSTSSEKDFRFWFHNAFRLATQMGLHRQNLGEDLDASTHKLCRRIWWLLFQRDIVFSLSGFENVRRISDTEADTAPLGFDDWHDEVLSEHAREILLPVTHLQKSFFIENCKLASLGAKFLRLFRPTGPPPSISTAYELAESIFSWRSSLPDELLLDRVTTWSSGNVWIIVLLAMSYRLECVFYGLVRERARGLDQDAFTWSKQRLSASVFELDTVIKRAIVHELVHLCPPSFIYGVSVLLTFQIELALDTNSANPLRTTAKAQIQAGLSYLRDIKERWHSAEWILRVFEWVVKRAGLALINGNGDTFQSTSYNSEQFSARHNDDGGDLLQQSIWMGAGGNIEGVPDPWMQAFLDENPGGSFDEGIFNFPTA